MHLAPSQTGWRHRREQPSRGRGSRRPRVPQTGFGYRFALWNMEISYCKPERCLTQLTTRVEVLERWEPVRHIDRGCGMHCSEVGMSRGFQLRFCVRLLGSRRGWVQEEESDSI